MASKEKTLMGYSGAVANGLLNNYLPLVYPYTRAALNPYEDIGEVEAAIEQSYQDYPEAYIPAAVAGTAASFWGPGAYIKGAGKLLSAGANAAKAKGVMKTAGLLGEYAPKVAPRAANALASLELAKMSPQVAESLLAMTTPFLRKPEGEAMGEFDPGARADAVTSPLNLGLGALSTASAMAAPAVASKAERQMFDTLKAGAKVNNIARSAKAKGGPVSENAVGRKMLDGGYWKGVPRKLLDKAREEADLAGENIGSLVDEADDVATQAGITINRKNIINYLQSEKQRLFGGAEHSAGARDGIKIFDNEISRIERADPKTLKQWWKEKSASDDYFDKTGVYAKYTKSLSRAVRNEMDNVTGELAKRSKSGLLKTPDIPGSAAIPGTPPISQYKMAEETAPHLQNLDELLGLSAPPPAMTDNLLESGGRLLPAPNKGLVPSSRSLVPNRGLIQSSERSLSRPAMPLVEGPFEPLMRDDFIEMVKSTKPGTPGVPAGPVTPGKVLNYDAGKYSDASKDYSTLKVIENALNRNVNKTISPTRKVGLMDTVLGGLTGDFTYGLRNNKAAYVAKGLDTLSKGMTKGKYAHSLIRGEKSSQPAQNNEEIKAGATMTLDNGTVLKFNGGDPEDENNWSPAE